MSRTIEEIESELLQLDRHAYGSSEPATRQLVNEETMSQKSSEQDDEMLPEYDFSGGVGGKYYEQFRSGTNLILLEPDVALSFHDSAAVNEALRQYLSEHGTPPAKSG